MKYFVKKSALTLFSALAFVFCGVTSSLAQAGTIEVNVIAVEISGTKFWFPSHVMAKKGDTVKIHAVSKIGGKNNIHGFAVDAFKVEELVDDKTKDIEFVANKAGIFPIRCHLHPAHVGGQLLVIE